MGGGLLWANLAVHFPQPGQFSEGVSGCSHWSAHWICHPAPEDRADLPPSPHPTRTPEVRAGTFSLSDKCLVSPSWASLPQELTWVTASSMWLDLRIGAPPNELASWPPQAFFLLLSDCSESRTWACLLWFPRPLCSSWGSPAHYQWPPLFLR